MLYHFGDRLSLGLCYPSTWVDYSEGNKNYFSQDTITHGPLTSIGWRW